MPAQTSLFYVYDPMCSWCWGYQPVLESIAKVFETNRIPWTKVLGGLAPDTQEPMPLELRSAIQGYWREIEALLGTSFNHDFWIKNTPRRSTYPACRAILIARRHGLEDDMNREIQHAYYLNAENPSSTSVLCSLAEKLGLNPAEFAEELEAKETKEALLKEIRFARAIGGNRFPSWILKRGDECTSLPFDYKAPAALVTEVLTAFAEP